MRTRCSSAAFAVCCALLAALPAAFAAAPAAPPAPAFDSQPWLEDLGQIRTAVATKYANLQWQVAERGVDLIVIRESTEGLFASMGKGVVTATEARETLEWRLDSNNPVLPFPVLDELREEGYAHYVIAPFEFEGLVNAIVWATRRPGGRSTRASLLSAPESRPGVPFRVQVSSEQPDRSARPRAAASRS